MSNLNKTSDDKLMNINLMCDNVNLVMISPIFFNPEKGIKAIPTTIGVSSLSTLSIHFKMQCATLLLRGNNAADTKNADTSGFKKGRKIMKSANKTNKRDIKPKLYKAFLKPSLSLPFLLRRLVNTLKIPSIDLKINTTFNFKFNEIITNAPFKIAFFHSQLSCCHCYLSVFYSLLLEEPNLVDYFIAFLAFLSV